MRVSLSRFNEVKKGVIAVLRCVMEDDLTHSKKVNSAYATVMRELMDEYLQEKIAAVDKMEYGRTPLLQVITSLHANARLMLCRVLPFNTCLLLYHLYEDEGIYPNPFSDYIRAPIR